MDTIAIVGVVIGMLAALAHISWQSADDCAAWRESDHA